MMAINWLINLKKGLTKSSNKIGDGLKKILKGKKLDEVELEKIEELLITSDIGVSLSTEIIETIRKSKFVDTTTNSIKKKISKSIIDILGPLEKNLIISNNLFVILVVGVNGVGKTATVGKLANRFSIEKKKVGIVACDTFRAAAKEQLEIWSKKVLDLIVAIMRSDLALLLFVNGTPTREARPP